MDEALIYLHHLQEALQQRRAASSANAHARRFARGNHPDLAAKARKRALLHRAAAADHLAMARTARNA